MKKLLTICLFAVCTAAAFAYNPPYGGENLEELVMPQLMSGGASASGGALFYAGPEQIAVNPALTAGEQRIVLDLGYTGLMENVTSFEYGSAFNIGLLVPSRWGVFTGALQGVFSPLTDLPLGNSVILRGGFARDITDDFYVGAGLDTGIAFTSSIDWMLNLDLGFWYRIGNWRALKDIRWGASLTGLGKPFSAQTLGLAGINSAVDAGLYPGFITPRTGIAATLIDTGSFVVGASADIAAPSFLNIVFDAGIRMCIANTVSLYSDWEVNAAEIAAGKPALIPSVGASFKFSIDTGSTEFFSSKGWQKNDMATSASWRALNGKSHAVSLGASVSLGVRDTVPPEIIIWQESGDGTTTSSGTNGNSGDTGATSGTAVVAATGN
jgi:hypothetical protein